MLLAIDIGNTNIHIGVYNQSDWCCSWRVRTIREKMSDEYAVLLRNFFEENGFGFGDIEHVVIASVVPDLTSAFVELVERYLQPSPLLITHETDSGVRLLLDNPREIGPDRIVNAAAAKVLYGGPAIVIDFGTATTFDVINTDGDYLGGVITTGIGLAHDALVSRAARLLAVDIAPPPAAIGRNTIHAMQSGLFLGYVSMIEGLVERIKVELNEPEVRVIGTGGLAPLFAQHTSVIQDLSDSLTLEGLRIIWERHHSNSTR
ncbi:MAG: type III pantothenate kinase [Chloroflexi bacterium]|nr:type III pantothenate kinase [Chloroflexota bacterium]